MLQLQRKNGQIYLIFKSSNLLMALIDDNFTPPVFYCGMNIMLGRGYQSCKQGCNAFNRGEYDVAIGHFREARGYARNAFTSEYKDKHFKASALLAECTTKMVKNVE